VPETAPSDFEAILKILVRHGVDFIVVGGVAAVLEGAPVNTFDLNIVHARDAANVQMLLAALTSLDAVYRTRREPRLKPAPSHLSSPGHQRLMTRFGPLDVLGRIGSARGYDELLAHTIEVELSEELRVRILDLETVIAVKEEVGGEKDAATLPILRRTLEEKRRV
jgi:hypothetical protein